MRPCIKPREIPPEVKAQLHEIPGYICRERFCTICPYYGGVYQKKRRCMLANCAWDDEREIFNPALKKVLTIAREECLNTKELYLEQKKKIQILEKMFAQELVEEEKENDKCYKCPYGASRTCIGICYRDLAGKGGKGE